MKNKERIIFFIIIIVFTYGYGLLLQYLGDVMPFVDSFTTVASVIAMIVSVRMFAEQWWIWVAIDIFSVYMWWCNFSQGSDNLATLLMWVIYLGNAIFMLIRWEKEVKNNKSAGEIV